MVLGIDKSSASFRTTRVAAAALILLVPGMGLTGAVHAAAPLVGTSLGSVDKMKSYGAPVDLGTMWVGVWSKSDWYGVNKQLQSAKAKGVTPMIQWYYWGDDISPTCVENGCYSSLHGGWKKKSDWNAMAIELAKRIRSEMGDRRVYVVLETEFNKQGMASYEPFDGYLAAQADIFRQYAPNAKLILGFGNWGWSSYKNFDRAIAKADYLGTQELKGSTRDSSSSYLIGAQRLVDSAKYLNTNFRKPVFITDSGFSSYPEPTWAGYQERVIKDVFAKMDDLEAAGVHAWMYRSVLDNPKMNTANYYGQAERHWGFVRSDGSWKPAMDNYVNGVKALRAARESGTGGTSSGLPWSLQAEGFDWKGSGSRLTDSRAEEGAAWAFWSNGHMKKSVTAPSTATYEMTVKARGTPASGVSPMMVLTVNDKDVGRWFVNARDQYWSYTAKVPLNAGQKADIRLYFVNDHKSASEDRNLFVDTVRVAASGVADSGSSTKGSREAESFQSRPVGGRHSDSRASGGAAWNVWSNGAIKDAATVSAGTYKLTLKAKGQLAGSAYPHMALKVDGQRAGSWQVRTTGDYWTYSVEKWLPAGEHQFAVEFTNDYFDRATGKDRNLLVDSFSWERIG